MSAPRLTPASLALFLAYAKDAGNWSGQPLVGGNVGGSKEDRGNLTQLKRAGLIKTSSDDGLTWITFTDLGRALASEHRVDGFAPKASAAALNGLAALPRRAVLDQSPEGIDSPAIRYAPPVISGAALCVGDRVTPLPHKIIAISNPVREGIDVEVDLPRPPACRRTASQTQSVAVAVNVLVCAALDVLDTRLTEEQRAIAEQIYDLCNSIEATI